MALMPEARTVAQIRVVCHPIKGQGRKKFHHRVTTWNLRNDYGFKAVVIGPCPKARECKLPHDHPPLRNPEKK